ncbi:LLM class flavin-dependent oxidoreductase [Naumannella sp. ID2617S]|nr:LLM class flavin-dependent oxidoreductase [Naumannella sp. ID2617S]
MRVGVCLLPEYAWAEAAPRWRMVEQLGFDHAWTYDHLVWGGLPQHPWQSTIVTLTAAAMVTERIPLGTWVASPNYRHPVTFARDLVSLADVAGPDRMICAVGSGGEPDAGMLGEQLTRGQRTSRFAEFVDVLQRALTEDPVDHEGRHYTVRGYRNLFGQAARPLRLVVAANGPRGMQVAVRHHAAWATTGVPADDVDNWWRGVAGLVDRLDDLGGGEVDRYLNLDSAPRFSLQGKEFCLEQLHRAAELGFTDAVIHWPRSSDPYRGDPDLLAEVAAHLPEFRSRTVGGRG